MHPLLLPLLVIGLLLLALAPVAWAYVQRTRQPDLTYTLDYVGQPEVGPYYVGLRDKLVEYPDRDSDGGILDVYEPTGQRYFHPLRNAHYAMALYAKYLETREEGARREFLRMADAIANHGTKREDGAKVWYYPHKFARDQAVPWISAMAQGFVIGVMCRAFTLTKDDRYLTVAREAFLPFQRPIREGGVCSDDRSLGVFYEEYAHAEVKHQNHTLNGMVSALFNLYDFWKVAGSPDVKRLFDEGVATIKANLGKYDFPFCSSYDLRHLVGKSRPLFNSHYNGVHVAHLHVLAALSGDACFDGVADCWDRKLRDRANRLRLAVSYLIWKSNDLIGKALSMARIKT